MKKVNIDTISSEEHYDGSTEPQIMQYTVTH